MFGILQVLKEKEKKGMKKEKEGERKDISTFKFLHDESAHSKCYSLINSRVEQDY